VEGGRRKAFGVLQYSVLGLAFGHMDIWRLKKIIKLCACSIYTFCVHICSSIKISKISLFLVFYFLFQLNKCSG
jgi:hypothetical protein